MFLIGGSRGHGAGAYALERPSRSRPAANGAALALLCAWLVDDRLARRRGGETAATTCSASGVIAAVLP